MPSQQSGTARDREFDRAQTKTLEYKKGSLRVVDQCSCDVPVRINPWGGGLSHVQILIP